MIKVNIFFDDRPDRGTRHQIVLRLLSDNRIFRNNDVTES